MYPGFYHRWKRSTQERAEEQWASECGRGGWRRRHGDENHYRAGGHGRGFGVRRPLRYMAHRLDLDDDQVDTLAGILNALKTERAQARLDEERSIAGVADAVEGESFDVQVAAEALALRVAAAERLKEQSEREASARKGVKRKKRKVCGFVMPRTVCKREITREEFLVYLRTGKTDLLEDFTSRFGRAHAAAAICFDPRTWS